MTSSSHAAYIIQVTICEEAAIVRAALTAPHVLYKPRLFADGDMWCALYGENIQEGVCGFGRTPADAMEQFDQAWRNDPTPDAMLKEMAIVEEDAEREREDNSQFGVGA